jgi:hypothetical protein
MNLVLRFECNNDDYVVYVILSGLWRVYRKAHSTYYTVYLRSYCTVCYGVSLHYPHLLNNLWRTNECLCMKKCRMYSVHCSTKESRNKLFENRNPRWYGMGSVSGKPVPKKLDWFERISVKYLATWFCTQLVLRPQFKMAAFSWKSPVGGGVHNHSLKRQEISKWSWQVTSPVWGKKMRNFQSKGCAPPPVQIFRFWGKSGHFKLRS